MHEITHLCTVGDCPAGRVRYRYHSTTIFVFLHVDMPLCLHYIVNIAHSFFLGYAKQLGNATQLEILHDLMFNSNICYVYYDKKWNKTTKINLNNVEE